MMESRNLRLILVLFGIVLFSSPNLYAQYDENFDMEGYLTGKWHNYRYTGTIFGADSTYPASHRVEYVFYGDSVYNMGSDLINSCTYVNDSLTRSWVENIFYIDSFIQNTGVWIYVPNFSVLISDSNNFVLSMTADDGVDLYFKRIDDIQRYSCQLEADTVTSNQEIAPELDFTVYPNPFEKSLNLAFEEAQNGNYHLFDLLGEMVHDGAFKNSRKIELNPLNLSKGIYFLEIELKNGEKEVVKLVKN